MYLQRHTLIVFRSTVTTLPNTVNMSDPLFLHCVLSASNLNPKSACFTNKGSNTWVRLSQTMPLRWILSRLKLSWNSPLPKTLKDVQGFLGFANFYCRVIRDYLPIVKPLTQRSRKDTPFVWSQDCQDAFDYLKIAFTTTPVLAHFDPDACIIVETDTSDFVSGGILSQYDANNILHPIAYFSKKYSPAEYNYTIYDKELRAVIQAFEEWRPHIEGSPHTVEVLTDHKSLEYFTTNRLLNGRQAR
jgi:hypothetical protein